MSFAERVTVYFSRYIEEDQKIEDMITESGTICVFNDFHCHL